MITYLPVYTWTVNIAVTTLNMQTGDLKWKHGDVGTHGVFVGAMPGASSELGEYPGSPGWHAHGRGGRERGGDDW